jgi:hypothetical protein
VQLLDQLVDFTSAYHQNSELISALLVKLSRKFHELNIYTQLKTSFLLHYAFEKMESSAKQEWCKILFALRSENDEKYQKYHFTFDLLLESISQSTTAMEMASVEFGRLYLEYILEYLNYQRKYRHNTKTQSSSVEERVKSLMSLLETNQRTLFAKQKFLPDSSSSMGSPPGDNKNNTSIFSQCFDLLSDNQQKLLSELKEFYHNHHRHNDPELLETIYQCILSYDENYPRRSLSPTAEMKGFMKESAFSSSSSSLSKLLGVTVTDKDLKKIKVDKPVSPKQPLLTQTTKDKNQKSRETVSKSTEKTSFNKDDIDKLKSRLESQRKQTYFKELFLKSGQKKSQEECIADSDEEDNEIPKSVVGKTKKKQEKSVPLLLEKMVRQSVDKTKRGSSNPAEKTSVEAKSKKKLPKKEEKLVKQRKSNSKDEKRK